MWAHKLQTNNFLKLVISLLAVAGMLTLSHSAQAASPVTQTYGVTGNVQNGMLVMLDPKNSNNVTPFKTSSQPALQGIVVTASDSAVNLTGDGTTDQVYVATNGKHEALVSNQNGPIKAGDYITISALDGIGMKADSSQTVILGKSLDNFDGTNNVSGTAQLTNSIGKHTTVALGEVGVTVDISNNPLHSNDHNTNGAPKLLNDVAYTVTGKAVSAIRIYICLGVLLVTLVITGILVYSGVKNSLTAIGRNPLARRSVLRGLFEVLFVSAIIFLAGIIIIYFLLKL